MRFSVYSKAGVARLTSKLAEVGMQRWIPMLDYLQQLHEAGTHPPVAPLPYEWEEIGTGYCFRPAFGHWDIVHIIFDHLVIHPVHARRQILNNLAAQHGDGFLPGTLYMKETPPKWHTRSGHPPVWPLAVDEYTARFGDFLLKRCLEPLIRQIGWYEDNRKAEGEGYFYTDIFLDAIWESGVDEGIRFLDAQKGRYACIDATSHICALYGFAADWSLRLKRDPEPYRSRHNELKRFIQEHLFSPETGFFHDIWSMQNPTLRCFSIESIWPLVNSQATSDQARSVVARLLDPKLFFSAHPLAAVSMSDPRFELRMWRGPAWNSMTFWAARGALNYNLTDAASQILERALDSTALQFERTGTIWEFYHPHGGTQTELLRKPNSPYSTPCRDYVGHNPLFAMAEDYLTTLKS